MRQATRRDQNGQRKAADPQPGFKPFKPPGHALSAFAAIKSEARQHHAYRAACACCGGCGGCAGIAAVAMCNGFAQALQQPQHLAVAGPLGRRAIRGDTKAAAHRTDHVLQPGQRFLFYGPGPVKFEVFFSRLQGRRDPSADGSIGPEQQLAFGQGAALSCWSSKIWFSAWFT